jgi:hypothetical protein
MTEDLEYPLPGEKYLHYKGGKYEIITLANHTDTGETMVIYKSLSFGSVYARPFKEWDDLIDSNLTTKPYPTYRFVKIN